MTSAQVGKTETFLNNPVGYFIAQDPAPILVIQPTLEMAQTWSKDRFAPMLRDSSALKDLVQDPRARSSNNTDLCTSKTGKFEEVGRVFGHKLDTNCNSEN